MKPSRPPLDSLTYLIASGFYSGLSPVISGTCGSAAALALWFLLRSSELVSAWGGELVVFLIITGIGTLASAHSLASATKNPHFYPKASKPKDPGFIVVDEWAGMWASLIGIPPRNWLLVLVAFVLFRLFDIIKPGPVRKAEGLPGAYGIMADDIVAGMFVALIMHLLIWFYAI